MKKLSKDDIEKSFAEYKEKKKEIVDNGLPIKGKYIRKITRPIQRLLLKGQRFINRQHVEIMGNKNYHIPKGKQVIFVVSHIGKWDFEIVNEQIKQQFYVLASDFRNMYGNMNGFMMNWFGVYFVDEVSDEDKSYTTKISKKTIREKCNLMILSEGTWNLSPNEIVMDTHFGAVDIALSEDALILPIGIEQDGKNFIINFGDLYDPNDIAKEVCSTPYKYLRDNVESEASLKYQIKLATNTDMRNRLATLKWYIWEKMPSLSRDNIPDDYWDKFIEERIAEWPGYSMQEQIDSVVHPPAKKKHSALLKELGDLFKRNPYYFLSTDYNFKRLLEVLENYDKIESLLEEYRAHQVEDKSISERLEEYKKLKKRKEN